METQKNLTGEFQNKNVGKSTTRGKTDGRFESYKNSIGSLRGTSRPEILPFRTSNGTNYENQSVAHTLNSSDWRGANRNQQQNLVQVGIIGEKDNMGQRVYNTEGISTCLRSQGGGQGAKTGLYAIPKIVAMRGRNPENPSERIAGNPTEQRLEENKKKHSSH